MAYLALAERRRTELITADATLRQLLRRFDWILAPEEWRR
jgi:predicted nucleic acid-binding protein